MSHIRDEIRTAIIPHVCYLCGYRIQVMEKYLRRVSTYDDMIFATPMHIACEAHTKDWDECDWDFHHPLDFRDNCLDEALHYAKMRRVITPKPWSRGEVRISRDP